MTLAGKKLQIIYDSGTESLTNIETDAISKLTGTANKAASHQRSSAASHSSVVETKSQEIEDELQGMMDKSLTKLLKLKSEETSKCKEHTESLTEELRRIGDLVRQSVESIKAGLNDNLGDVSRELASEFDKTYEQNVSGLMASNFEGSKEIRSHANGLTTTLQQKLDQSVWESKGSEKQTVSQLYKNYMQKASAIETHFSQIMQQLSSEFQVQYKNLEDGAGNAKADISKDVDGALRQIEEVSAESERDLNQFFVTISEEHETELDSELSRVSREISQNHGSATDTLRQKTQDYSSSLLTEATTSLETLKGFCQNTVENAENLHAEFISRMEGRVTGSKDTREQLEATKVETIKEICNELATMRRNFEDKLDRLTVDAENSVKNVSVEVEREIKTAHSRCLNKLADDGQAAKYEIDKETRRLLTLIEQHKRAALSEIASAAGADPTR